jgi:hypothetical protein
MRAVLVLGGLLLAAPAFGYTAAPPHSFAKPTPGGKFVLVMLHQWDGPPGKELSKKYGRSGLYPADDLTKPAWTCDWRADWEHNVFASDDGVFAVRVPNSEPGLRRWLLSNDRQVEPKKPGWEDAPALHISKNGQPFRTLALRQVFDCSRFTDRDCFMGPIVTIDSFLDPTGHVTISAQANGRKQTAMVAFRTGEVIEGRGEGAIVGGDGGSGSDGAWYWGRVILTGVAVVGVGTAAFIGLVVLLVREQRTRKGA